MLYLSMFVLAAAFLEVLTAPAASYANMVSVPEPGTIVLVGAGAAAAGATAWLKRRRKK